MTLLSISLIGFLFFFSSSQLLFSPTPKSLNIYFFKCTHWDFPGGLALETLPPPVQRVQVRSLIRELIFHGSYKQKTKTGNIGNNVTNSIKILKMALIGKIRKQTNKKRPHFVPYAFQSLGPIYFSPLNLLIVRISELG